MTAVSAPLVVLVVEDEAPVTELIEPALVDAGYSVLVSRNGREGFKHLERNADTPIRALVTDINLGSGPSGWEVATRARELHPDMPVVYMTGGEASDWPSKGVPHSLIIQKPFAPAQIVTAVSQLLNAPTIGPPST
jgi:DNA-binding response OmpR family regulator